MMALPEQITAAMAVICDYARMHGIATDDVDQEFITVLAAMIDASDAVLLNRAKREFRLAMLENIHGERAN